MTQLFKMLADYMTHLSPQQSEGNPPSRIRLFSGPSAPKQACYTSPNQLQRLSADQAYGHTNLHRPSGL